MSHQGYQPLSTKDVVFVEGLANSALLFKTDATLRVKDLLARVEAICASSDQLSAEEVQMLFGQGIACEVLRPGATDWQQGRLQFNIGFESGIPAPKVPIAMKTATIEHARTATMTSGRSETIESAKTATIERPIATPIATPVVVPPVVVPPVAAVPVVAATPVVAPPTATASVNRASLVTPIVAPPSPVMVAEDLPELDLASFSNATDHEINRDNDDINHGDINHGDMDHGDIDHSDVFSLMEAADVTPLGDDFSFSAGLEGLEGLEALNFDADEPPSKSISSPWDLEELDGMLMLK
jgi:KGK domain